MPVLQVQNTTVVPRIYSRVYIRGRRRSDFYCTQVVPGLGTAGTSASLEIPGSLWDSKKDWLTGAPVTVEYGYPRSRPLLFHGYIIRPAGDIGENMIRLEAGSAMKVLSDGWFVGDGLDGDFVAEYPERALRGGVPVETGWTLKSILRDIWSSKGKTWRGGGGSLASQVRSTIKLGSLSILSASWNNFPMGDLVFEQYSLKTVLNKLLAMTGNITFAEDFRPGGKTYLRFFELGPASGRAKTVRVARVGQAALGSNVLGITHEYNTDDVLTRLVAFGAPKKFVISVSTGHPSAPLIKDWDSGLEPAVLSNPEGTLRGNESGKAGDGTRSEFTEEKARVGRWFKLPDVLRKYVIGRDNALETADGRKLDVQFWMMRRVPAYNPTTKSWGSTAATSPTLLEGVEFEPENYRFRLRKPAVSLVSQSISEGEIVDVYSLAEVGVTLTVEAERLRYDTGVKQGRVGFDDVRAAGVSDSITNESYAYIQITNEDFDFVDEDGVSHIFGDVWIFTTSAGWTRYTSKSVVRDLSASMQQLGDSSLRERLDIRAVYQIATPFLTGGYRLGDIVRFVGQNDFDYGVHQVQGLAHNLTNDHGTTFNTDNLIPLVATEILRTAEFSGARVPEVERSTGINPKFLDVIEKHNQKRAIQRVREAARRGAFKSPVRREREREAREIAAFGSPFGSKRSGAPPAGGKAADEVQSSLQKGERPRSSKGRSKPSPVKTPQQRERDRYRRDVAAFGSPFGSKREGLPEPGGERAAQEQEKMRRRGRRGF